MAQSHTTTYEVHLDPTVAEELGIEARLETDRIDYYDAGCWVVRDDGRDFFPYGHVLAIHERSAAAAAPPDTEESSIGAPDVED